MIKSYLTIALRNLRRSPGFSFINIFGMAIGMAACLLILQYVTFERSYDDFHPDVANLYRIELDNYQNGKLAFRSATSYPAIAPTMKKDFPEVVETARLYDANSEVVTYNNVHFREDNFYYADNSVFKVFKIDFLKGDPASALKDHGTVVMSETMARKYFGEEDPMGRR
jgi:putative ABC transport system permease protein